MKPTLRSLFAGHFSKMRIGSAVESLVWGVLWHIMNVSCSVHFAGTDSHRGIVASTTLSAVVLVWYMASTHVPSILLVSFVFSFFPSPHTKPTRGKVHTR